MHFVRNSPSFFPYPFLVAPGGRFWLNTDTDEAEPDPDEEEAFARFGFELDSFCGVDTGALDPVLPPPFCSVRPLASKRLSSRNPSEISPTGVGGRGADPGVVGVKSPSPFSLVELPLEPGGNIHDLKYETGEYTNSPSLIKNASIIRDHTQAHLFQLKMTKKNIAKMTFKRSAQKHQLRETTSCGDNFYLWRLRRIVRVV